MCAHKRQMAEFWAPGGRAEIQSGEIRRPARGVETTVADQAACSKRLPASLAR